MRVRVSEVRKKLTPRFSCLMNTETESYRQKHVVSRALQDGRDHVVARFLPVFSVFVGHVFPLYLSRLYGVLRNPYA